MAAQVSSEGVDETPSAREHFIEEHRRVWNEAAVSKGWGGAYHRRLAEIYGFLVSSGASVLELGCATGDLLAALRPSRGLGVDFAENMLSVARVRLHSGRPAP